MSRVSCSLCYFMSWSNMLNKELSFMMKYGEPCHWHFQSAAYTARMMHKIICSHKAHWKVKHVLSQTLLHPQNSTNKTFTSTDTIHFLPHSINFTASSYNSSKQTQPPRRGQAIAIFATKIMDVRSRHIENPKTRQGSECSRNIQSHARTNRQIKKGELKTMATSQRLPGNCRRPHNPAEGDTHCLWVADKKPC